MTNGNFIAQIKGEPYAIVVYIVLYPSILFASPEHHSNLPKLISMITSLILLSLLILLSYYDIKSARLPSKICKIGSLLGISSSGLLVVYLGWNGHKDIFFNHIFTTLIVLLILQFISKVLKNIFKREVIGIGDANFASMGGAWLGMQGIAIAISIAFIAAGTFSLIGRISGKLKPFGSVPFGPFLSIGLWGVWLFEPNSWIKGWQGLWGL